PDGRRTGASPGARWLVVADRSVVALRTPSSCAASLRGCSSSCSWTASWTASWSSCDKPFRFATRCVELRVDLACFTHEQRLDAREASRQTQDAVSSQEFSDVTRTPGLVGAVERVWIGVLDFFEG